MKTQTLTDLQNRIRNDRHSFLGIKECGQDGTFYLRDGSRVQPLPLEGKILIDGKDEGEFPSTADSGDPFAEMIRCAMVLEIIGSVVRMRTRAERFAAQGKPAPANLALFEEAFSAILTETNPAAFTEYAEWTCPQDGRTPVTPLVRYWTE